MSYLTIDAEKLVLEFAMWGNDCVTGHFDFSDCCTAAECLARIAEAAEQEGRSSFAFWLHDDGGTWGTFLAGLGDDVVFE